MSSQPSFNFVPLEPSPARRSDPETAQLAARANRVARGTNRWDVLVELYRAGEDGCTDYELGERTGLLRTSAGKRRKELQEIGYVCDSGIRRVTDTGSSAIVWQVTFAGESAYVNLSKET